MVILSAVPRKWHIYHFYSLVYLFRLPEGYIEFVESKVFHLSLVGRLEPLPLTTSSVVVDTDPADVRLNNCLLRWPADGLLVNIRIVLWWVGILMDLVSSAILLFADPFEKLCIYHVCVLSCRLSCNFQIHIKNPFSTHHSWLCIEI